MMLKDGQLLAGGITQPVISKVFANVQNDMDVREMDYSEFLESLAAGAYTRPFSAQRKHDSWDLLAVLVVSLTGTA
jgi:hypothetical protein